MVNKSTDLPETIDCTGKECECDISVIDCFYVHNAEVPQIGVKCPECGKVAALSKTKSIAYAEAYPPIQQSIDSAVGFRSPEPDDHESFADRVLRLLDVYGYTQSKWTSAKKIIRQLIENSPGPHTVPLINEILTSRKVDRTDAYQIANLAMGGESQSALGVSGIFAPQGSTYPQQIPYPQQMQQPAYPYQQQMPQQVPYQPQMPQQIPYPQTPPTPQPANDDSITIIEKLGEDGQVIERVIKQPKQVDTPTNNNGSQLSVADQMKEMIEVMGNAGMIRGVAEPEPQPTVEDIIERLIPLIEKPEPNDKYDKISNEISSLKDMINQNASDKLNERFGDLESRIANVGQAGMSDAQHADVIRKDIENARLDMITDVINKAAKPLIDMQVNQAKFNTMMMVQNAEHQAGAKPGTYAQMFAPTSVPDETVQSDLDTWRTRAGRAGSTA